jgi:molecular chaperone GrpE
MDNPDVNQKNNQNSAQPQPADDVAQLKEKITELENNWKRALADYRNLQRRTEEEKESLAGFIGGTIFKRLVPVLDNLELLEKHLDDIGLKMIVNDFRQMLVEEGVTEVNVVNKDFDAQTMEAIELVDGPENKVVEVINKGYLFKNKLLRPARVKVGKPKEA